MNMSDLTAKVIGDLGDKRRWRNYKARSKQLPASYRTAADACERYLLYTGRGGDVAIFEDLIELFEQRAADRTPLRDVVGADPAEYMETFARNYRRDSWIDRERDRLDSAIARATAAGK
ncbi:DUF1048 domain-containing protein [Nocardia carnea]|uniref:DUF1048 domain-containing protein n=1 Tax=Nocardia carnea TaxID=37328 RepID=UPI002455FF24|nr:DUF1048 domain-containing protein [Nocardia carnea]